MFDINADFAQADIDAIPVDEGAEWQKWIQNESKRRYGLCDSDRRQLELISEYFRTSWLIYVLDTLVCLETASTPILFSRDITHLPLPCPESVWKAPSPADWLTSMSRSTGISFTLDFVMERLFDIPVDETPISNPESLLDVMELGLFARLVTIVSVMRAIIEYGEGRMRGGYAVRRWILNNPGKGIGQRLAYDGFSIEFHAHIVAIFNRVLMRVRLCCHPFT